MEYPLYLKSRNKLVEFFEPLSIEACGTEWRLRFDSLDTMEQSTWVDGTTFDLDKGEKAGVEIEYLSLHFLKVSFFENHILKIFSTSYEGNCNS